MNISCSIYLPFGFVNITSDEGKMFLEALWNMEAVKRSTRFEKVERRFSERLHNSKKCRNFAADMRSRWQEMCCPTMLRFY